MVAILSVGAVLFSSAARGGGKVAAKKKKANDPPQTQISSFFTVTKETEERERRKKETPQASKVSKALPTLPTAGEGGKGGEECEGVEGGEDGGQPPHARFKDGKCKEKCWCKRDAAAERKRQREKERMRDKRNSMSQEDKKKENDEARARMATDENREKDRQRKAEKKAAEEENAHEQSKQQNKEWFKKERGALPPEARNDLDAKAATGEWRAYRPLEITVPKPGPPNPIPPQPTPPHLTSAAVMATALGSTPDPDAYTETLVQYMDTTATGRSHLRAAVTDNTMPPHDDQKRPLLPRSGILTGKRPAQGRLTSADRAVLKEREERGIWEFHRDLASLGNNIMTCRRCGVRKKIADPTEGCTKCDNGGFLFTADNHLSLRPVNNAASLAEEAERKELLELMAPGTLTHLELALIKPAVSIVGIKRLRSGQFGFSGHTITLSQDVAAIARDLPRTVADAGIITVTDLEDKDNALDNVNVKRTFRVRRRVVQRTLELLFKYHYYMHEMYGGVGLNQENLDALPEDGVPTDDFLFHEKFKRALHGPGELSVTTNLIFRWLEAGDEDGVSYPIAAAAFNVYHARDNTPSSSSAHRRLGLSQGVITGTSRRACHAPSWRPASL